MIAVFAAKSLPHFTPREVATIHDPKIINKKNTWSIRSPPAALDRSVTTRCCLNQPEGTLDPRIKTISVGIHAAALTEGRRLQSRTRSQAMKTKQKNNSRGAIW